MKKLSLLVLIGFLCINSFAQKIPYMTKIDKQELKYMDKNALSLMDWSEYMFYIKDHYGETSEQYIATIPNIEKFNSHLRALGLDFKEGKIIDASFVVCPRQKITKEENK